MRRRPWGYSAHRRASPCCGCGCALQVPRVWRLQNVELACGSLALWVADLMSRLDFLYGWAVEGPPVAMPLGLLSRPRSYLTAVQQVSGRAM